MYNVYWPIYRLSALLVYISHFNIGMLHHIDLGSNTAQCQNVNYETQINFLSACKECSSRSYKRKNYEKDNGYVFVK